MNYTDRYNELLKEMKALIRDHNDEIYVVEPYNLVFRDSEGVSQAGSGDITDQIALLLVHMGAVGKIVSEQINKELPPKEWGFIIGGLFADVYDGKENEGEWSSKEIKIKI